MFENINSTSEKQIQLQNKLEEGRSIQCDVKSPLGNAKHIKISKPPMPGK